MGVAAVSLLTTSGLTRHFSGIHAVEGVDFTLEAGEIRALIGSNGAGKTTLVSMICGRIPPSAGEIHFDGRDITRWPAHRRIMAGMAYTFQISSIYAGLPVFENVALAARRKRRGRAAEAATQEALMRVGLWERADQPAGDLAYGHQRLLEIAMGLAQSPRLLILDEPTQGLSEGEIAAFKALIRELAPATTILLIEHNMSVVMELAERVTVMDMGRILAEGTPAEIRANRAVQAAYLGTG
ncbi:branched-chain amino acid transport system ATP-binding protein [Meinhardsimonia xiamenensis]|uniref:Branched-chain amino acid transport system ATP-binding protein n=1 Tax=Meinhardsimonia xiamenensis TaxID=990712 RepID=A0A1G9CYL6_9RHOB|nr:amino acid/amide ABC transporter ATP-binding protein 1 (HAAT family) [Meinhardsimonia xiamenensis]SDK56749.1 branched-chain amino acid transport system ATP-binding protein [Meinhardsimonia xiamenensis]